MNWILDLIILGIVLLTVLISAKKGFVKAVVETAGFIAAVMLAFTMSSPLAEVTYDKIIEPPILNAVEASTQSAEDEAVSAIPNFITKNAERLGVSLEEFENKISNNVSDSVLTATKTASQEVLKPVATKILGLVYSVILVIILLVVVKFLAKIINKIFSFSIVGKLNRTLGGILGLVKGSVFAVLFCMIVALIMAFAGDFLIFTEENINNSYLFQLIINTFSF
ncbi:MAG: CvpA family protein [Clostridia bacterium]|nr:CvpA family protein [Clostridia bacterium]